jgi:hypothetical protein
MFVIIEITLGDCCVKQVGADRNPWNERVSGTTWRGSKWPDEHWPQIKKSRRRQGHHLLGRQSEMFSAVDGGAHLGTTETHTAATGQIDPGSPLGHQWHHFRRRLFIQVRSASYDAAAMVGFLHVLLRKISGKIVVIYDGAPIQQDTKSRSFSNEEQPSACIWGSCLAMRPTSIWMRASGMTSSELSEAMCVVPTGISRIDCSFERKALAAQRGDHQKVLSSMRPLRLVP